MQLTERGDKFLRRFVPLLSWSKCSLQYSLPVRSQQTSAQSSQMNIELCRWNMDPNTAGAFNDTNHVQSRRRALPVAGYSRRSYSENTPCGSRAPLHKPFPPYRHASHTSGTCHPTGGRPFVLSRPGKHHSDDGKEKIESWQQIRAKTST